MALIEREVLEKMALEACPAVLYYDLLDEVDAVTDGELWDIINEDIPEEHLRE